MTPQRSRKALEQELTAICASAMGCGLVAFGDLKTQSVLAESRDAIWKGAQLERFFTEACQALSLLEHVAGQPDHLVALAPDEARIFVRHRHDIIMLAGADLTEMQALIPKVRDILHIGAT